MSADPRNTLGATGEELAARYLCLKGYTILHRNYRCRAGEIDIVARQDDTLVFIEVKTRTTNRFGSPAEAVTRRKQRQISRVAQYFLAHHRLFDSPARFDIVSVLTGTSRSPVIEIITDAFEYQGG